VRSWAVLARQRWSSRGRVDAYSKFRPLFTEVTKVRVSSDWFHRQKWADRTVPITQVPVVTVMRLRRSTGPNCGGDFASTSEAR
jgi:hypothetical protein